MEGLSAPRKLILLLNILNDATSLERSKGLSNPKSFSLLEKSLYSVVLNSL